MLADLRIITTKKSILFLSGIFLTFFSNVILSFIFTQQPVSTSLRTLALVIFTSINMYIIPDQMEFDKFLRVLSRIGAAIVLIALPTVFVDSYSIIGYEIYAYKWNFNLPTPIISSEIINPIQGPFNQPNIFGFITSVALIGSFKELRTSYSTSSILLTLINLSGSYLSGSRAAFYFSIFATVIFFLYIYFDLLEKKLVAYFILLLSLTFTTVISGILPISNPFLLVDLQNRAPIWSAAVDAIRTKPLIGFGPGDQVDYLKPFYMSELQNSTHNSFLRMFLTTGLLGGISYILLLVHVISCSVTSIKDEFDPSIAAVILLLVLHQTFAGFAIFASIGVSVYAVISAIMFGYAIRRSAYSGD